MPPGVGLGFAGSGTICTVVGVVVSVGGVKMGMVVAVGLGRP